MNDNPQIAALRDAQEAVQEADYVFPDEIVEDDGERQNDEDTLMDETWNREVEQAGHQISGGGEDTRENGSVSSQGNIES